MSKQTVQLVIEVSKEDAEAILFNDLHGNTQSIADSGAHYTIISADTLESLEEDC